MDKYVCTSLVCLDGCSKCQLRCPGCPTVNYKAPLYEGRGYLAFSDFKTLLDDTPQIKEAFIESRGELFINPDLYGIMEYGYEKGVSVRFGSTNSNYISDEVLEGLVKFRVKGLTCAIDGVTQETYSIYQKGGKVNRVIGNIRKINEFKRKYNSRFPELTWIFVVFGHNEHEIRKAREMAGELNMKFYPKMQWDSDFSPVRDKELVLRETGWDSVSREEFTDQSGRAYMRCICYELWDFPRISWNGGIMGCCWNTGNPGDEFGGNAFKDGYIAAIDGERINYARKMLMGKAEPRGDLLCDKCVLYLHMRGNGDYIKPRELSYRPYWYRAARYFYRAAKRSVTEH